MNLRALATAAAVAVCLTVNQQSATAQQTKDAPQDSLPVRYAAAQLKQAELALKKAQQLNQRVARTLSDATMAQFISDVEFAKAHLQEITQTGKVDSYRDTIARIELSLRAAEARLIQVTRQSKLAPGNTDATDVERARVNLEVAQLQLERGRSLANATPPEKLQWQLEMLADNLARLKVQVMVISQNRVAEF